MIGTPRLSPMSRRDRSATQQHSTPRKTDRSGQTRPSSHAGGDLVRGMEARRAALAELTERIHPAAAHLATAKLLGVTAASLDESAEALVVMVRIRTRTGRRRALITCDSANPLGEVLRLITVCGFDCALPSRPKSSVCGPETSPWLSGSCRADAFQTRRQRRSQNRSGTRTALRRRCGHAVSWPLHAPLGLFQNAIRLAVGLAAARLVAGELDLSHGFWMPLATLTLMRTSVATTRAAVVPVSGNNRRRIDRGIGTGIGRGGFDGV